MKLFNKKLTTLECEAKHLIDKCIPTLRSTSVGIELMNDISDLHTRECLVEHMLGKYDSIVRRFISEIDTIQHHFQV